MPEIRDDRLTLPYNRCLIAHKDERLNDVLARLQKAEGQNWWHLIVDWGNGEFRAITFGELAKQLVNAPRGKVLEPLANFNLPAAKAVDKFSSGTAVAEDLARQQPNGLVVVTEKGKAVGLLYVGSTRSAIDGPTILNYYLLGDAMVIRKSYSYISMRDYGDISTYDVADDDKKIMEEREGPKSAPSRFDAYPALDAPKQVAPEARFTVTVGFRTDPDPELRESQAIHLENPQPGVEFLVMLIPDGAKVLGDPYQSLPLDLKAQATFNCQVAPGVHRVTLTVHYLYQMQKVGLAMREVTVGTAAIPIKPEAGAASNPCRLSLPSAESRVDLEITILQSKSKSGALLWMFHAARPEIKLGPIETELADARGFAGQLINDLKSEAFTGPLAARILENKGQDIADIMPREFFDVLRQVRDAVGKLPTLLLLTDEVYVPWELARLPKPLLDPNRPPFLATQTYLSRWLHHEKVILPPPITVDVQRLTAVASKYGQGTGQVELKEAMAERNALERRGATPLEATKAELTKIIVGERTPGHLIHFAVHGLSDPAANTQELVLADKKRIKPSALAGSYECGDIPTFAFIFINACQVGTGGSSLGQAAGFPGDLIRGGAVGFIAPLWEVDDAPARVLAEAFYSATFDNHQTVAEVLHAQRLTYNPDGTTTPLAYIYYGHPALRLQRPN